VHSLQSWACAVTLWRQIIVKVAPKEAKAIGAQMEQARSLEQRARQGDIAASTQRQALLMALFRDTGAAKTAAIEEYRTSQHFRCPALSCGFIPFFLCIQ